MNSLPEAEQVIWRRLAVFEGGFSREAAEAVCAGEGVEKDDVSHLLARAVDQCLLIVQEPGGDTRYRLPELLHQELRLRLPVSENVDTLRDQHATFYLKLAMDAAHQPFSSDRVRRLDSLERDHQNLIAALYWLMQRRELERAWKLAASLWDWWRWHLDEGRAWFSAFLALTEMASPTTLRAQALDLASTLAFYVALQSDGGDDSATAATAECRLLGEESLSIRRELGDKEGIAQSMLHAGVRARVLEGDFSRSRALLEESRDVYQELRDECGIAYTFGHLMCLALHQGDHTAARARMEESLTRYRELGMGDDWTVGLLDSGARYAAAHNQPERAVRLAAAARAQREIHRFPLFLQDALERTLKPARQALDEAAWATAWEEGGAMTLKEAVSYALEEAAGSPPPELSLVRHADALDR